MHEFSGTSTVKKSLTLGLEAEQGFEGWLSFHSNKRKWREFHGPAMMSVVPKPAKKSLSPED